MGTSKALSLVACSVVAVWISAAASTQAIADQDDWEKDWTALTVSDGGDWGTATGATLAATISAAIGECRARAGLRGGGCGAHTTTVREAWSVAYVCGKSTFIVTARSLQAAHADAKRRMTDLRDNWQVDVDACRQIVTIGPDGRPAARQAPSRGFAEISAN